MLKRISFIYLAAALVLGASLAGCSRSKAGKSGSQGTGAAKNVSIEFWTGPAWKGVFDATVPGADFGDFLRYAADKFAKQNPGVTINIGVLAPEQRDQRISVAIQSKSLPAGYFDAFFVTSDYAHAGLLVPLNDIITDEDRADIPESVFNEVTINNQTFIFPYYIESGHLAVNASLFEQAGAGRFVAPENTCGSWTPDEFREALRAVKGLTGVYPFAIYAGSAAGDTWTNMLLRMFGAQFFNKETSEILLNGQEGIQALEFLKSLKDEGLLAPGIETMTVQDAIQLFANKKTAVAIFQNFHYPDIVAGLEQGTIEKPFDIRLMYIPNIGRPTCFAYIKGGMVFNSGDETKIDITKQFVKFFSTDKELVKASMVTLPVRKSLLDEFAQKDKFLATISDSMDYLAPFSQNAPGYLKLRAVFYPEMQAFFGGMKTAKQALDDFAKNGNVILRENAAQSVLLKH